MDEDGETADETADESADETADDQGHRSYLKLAAIPVVALVIGLIVVLRGGGVPGLDDARDRWEENGPASYTMTYETDGMTGSLRGTVVVIDGVVDTFVSAPESEIGPPVVTVEELFDAIDDADAVEGLEFDADLGHPLRVDLDPETDAIDDEWGFRLLSFDPID